MLHYCFHRGSSSHWEPSNWSIKSLYKETNQRDFGSSRQVSKHVQHRSTTPRPISYPACQQFNWYESINRPTITTPLSSPRRGGWTFSRYTSWNVQRERRHLIATKKKRRWGRTLLNKLFLLQSTVIPKNKSDYYFLPWESNFECFFFANSFLLDTMYFGSMLQY